MYRMKEQVDMVRKLQADSIPLDTPESWFDSGWTYEIEAGDDEIRIIYRHRGPDGQHIQTTLIVTNIIHEL